MLALFPGIPKGQGEVNLQDPKGHFIPFASRLWKLGILKRRGGVTLLIPLLKFRQSQKIGDGSSYCLTGHLWVGKSLPSIRMDPFLSRILKSYPRHTPDLINSERGWRVCS